MSDINTNLIRTSSDSTTERQTFKMHKLVVFVFLLVGDLMAHDSLVPGELSKKMCKKYANDLPEDCTVINSELTLGNSFAARDEFPHMATIGYKKDDDEEEYKWFAGGSLISDDFVLIAAHATNNKNSGIPKVVRIGVTDLNATDHLQEIKVKEVLAHPNYTHRAIYNDIGLLKLEKKVDISRYARPACLFTEKEVNVEKAISTGWGATEVAGGINNNLQKVVVELYDQPSCDMVYNNSNTRTLQGITYDNMICAGTKSIITILPQAGGSLVTPHKGEGSKCLYDIIGVASSGKRAGKVNTPDIYTRVSAYLSWIEENVWK